MSKELEAPLKETTLYLLQKIKKYNMCLGAEYETGYIQIGTRSVDMLIDLLAPPTAEEVCKALSEYYDWNVVYENTKFKNGFHNHNVYIVNYNKETSEVSFASGFFNAKLPPHLIALIGRFYQELEE